MSTFLDRHPHTRSAVDTAILRGGARAARVDAHPAARRAALRALPAMLKRQFNADAAAAGDAIIELRIRASDGGPERRFRLAVAGGQLAVRRGPAADAVSWVSVSLGDMILMVSGANSLWELLAARRLDFGGEPFTALRAPALLGL